MGSNRTGHPRRSARIGSRHRLAVPIVVGLALASGVAGASVEAQGSIVIPAGQQSFSKCVSVAAGELVNWNSKSDGFPNHIAEI